MYIVLCISLLCTVCYVWTSSVTALRYLLVFFCFSVLLPVQSSSRRAHFKTALHYSSQLLTWFSTKFAAKFSTSSCEFATRFRPAFDFFVENLVANLLHQSRHVEKTSFFLSKKTSFFNMLSTCLRPVCNTRKSATRFAARFAAG